MADIGQALREAEGAMLGLLAAFERHIASLESQNEQAEISGMNAKAQALRDSAGIYMTWAKQYAKLVAPEAEKDREAWPDDFLDEGGRDFQNPIFG